MLGTSWFPFRLKRLAMQHGICMRWRRAQPLALRGPFGNSFTESRGRVLLVGGGTGTAPLLFLAKQLAAKTERLSFVEGAKTKDELLFVRELRWRLQREKPHNHNRGRHRWLAMPGNSAAWRTCWTRKNST